MCEENSLSADICNFAVDHCQQEYGDKMNTIFGMCHIVIFALIVIIFLILGVVCCCKKSNDKEKYSAGSFDNDCWINNFLIFLRESEFACDCRKLSV